MTSEECQRQWYTELRRQLKLRNITYARALRAVGEDCIFQHYRVRVLTSTVAQKIADYIKANKIK